jgi:CubicO group peptidase (beta-lactamase class C family)
VPHDRHETPPIGGYATPEFEAVKVEFERNFTERGEQGAACAVYHHGRKVVDLFGGNRCAQTKSRWDEQTLTLVFSVTKGMAAAAMAVAHSRGLFGLDDPVAAYWPEFAKAGKERITIRQLLAHQAGLVSIDERLDAQQLADPDTLADILARQAPCWRPGTRHGYHTLTLGWYQSELIRRTDPKRRTLGAFFQEEIAQPLGIEFYIGLPDCVDEKRLSNVQGFHRLAMLAHLRELPPAMVLAGIWPRSLVSRSVRFLPISNPANVGNAEYRRVEIPSANGIGQASAVAKVYDVLARGGRELGITAATWRELVAPSIAPVSGSFDAILKIDTKYSFGFSRPSGDFQFGADHRAFGCPGAGGCFGMADPSQQLAFAFLTNRMGFRIFDDPREKAVRKACYASLSAIRDRRFAA